MSTTTTTTNAIRAFKGLHALYGYASVYHWPERGTWDHPPTPGDDTPAVAGDLVADLMHYLAEHGFDPRAIVEMGMTHYAEESAPTYAERVAQLEAEGATTSDAQAIAEAEGYTE